MKRSKKRRKARKRVLILCEGETERNYFQSIKEDNEYKLRLLAVHTQVVTAKNPTPEQITKEALQRKREAIKEDNPYEEIWIVFDHDNHAHRQEAFEKAIKNKLNIGFSAIAFEIWYLLHFIKSTRPFTNANDLIKELRKYYEDYQKAKRNDYLQLREKLETAIKNAIWLRQRMKEEIDKGVPITDLNPYTNIDELITFLLFQNDDS